MKNILFYLLLFSLASCGGLKQVSLENMPSWLREHPSSSEYFVGVGSAQKLGTPDTYMKAAKESALADMSQYISVNLTSVSTSNILESNDELHESFQQDVKARSSEIFEGVELVDQFDDGVNYHSYFRISKAEFFRLKEERKQKALSLGLSYYIQAKEQERDGNLSIALSLYVKVLNSIVYYLNESTMINNEGKDVELAYEARNSFDRLALSLSINSLNNSIEIKRGASVKDAKLTFVVEYNANAVIDIPVSFKYSGGYLRQNHDLSDNNGEVSTSIQKMDSNNRIEKIEAELDLQDIVYKSSDDLFIRKLFASYPRKSSSISIKIKDPSILLNSEDKDIKYLERLRKSLANAGIDVQAGKDYSLNLSIEYKKEKNSYGYRFDCIVNINVKSSEEFAKHKSLSYTFTAEDSSQDKAEAKAIDKLNKALDRLIASEIARFVLQ